MCFGEEVDELDQFFGFVLSSFQLDPLQLASGIFYKGYLTVGELKEKEDEHDSFH